MTTSELREHILRLSVEERVALVDEIWESLREDPEGPPITDAQRDELDRRLAVKDAVTVPWSVVRDRLRAGR